MLSLEGFQQVLLTQLAGGAGLQALVRAASKALDQPVSVCDAAYTLLAAFPLQDGDDGVFVLQSTRRSIMRPEIVEELQQKGITARLQKSRDAFCVYNSSLGLWELFCAVSIQKQVAGYLFSRMESQPDQIQLDCWSALGSALAAEFQKRDLLPPDPAQSSRAAILRQLIEGQLVEEELAQTRLRQTGWKPRAPYRLYCLFSPESSLFARLPHQQLLRQLADLLPDSLCCPAREQILLLCPDAEPAGVKLRHWLHYHGFLMAGSMPFSPLCTLPEAETQAQAVVELLLRCAEARAGQCEDPIFYFERVLPLCAFLHSYPMQQIEPWLHPHIRAFLAHDQTHGTDYIRTLNAYFVHNRNTAAASGALYIHKTTLFYRFSQMEKLAGPFLRDPELLFLYEYSLRLLRLTSDGLARPADA